LPEHGSKVEEARVIHSDCLEAMRGMDACTFHSVVTDPPYGLGFMGKGWDHGVPGEPFWREVIRVSRPGAYLLAFGGTRTFHRLACAIEDAGWELRDTLMWVYGSGFPKSLDVSKAIDKAAGEEGGRGPMKRGGERLARLVDGKRDGEGRWGDESGRDPFTYAPATEAAKQWHGWGTALKPAWEPIIMARKPLVGTVAENVQLWGCGAVNVDGCRIALNGDYKCGANGRPSQTGLGDNYDPSKANQHCELGRWPANLIHDGSEEVVELFPAEAGAAAPVHVRNGDKFRAAYGRFQGNIDEEGSTYRGDSGSAARFFYCAKASRSERGDGNNHPTVKPLALMEYLIRLVTPPEGVVLDPFCGSGSTGVAAFNQGMFFVGIEREKEYVEIARKRIKRAQNKYPLFA
jgi:hypothetical protein